MGNEINVAVLRIVLSDIVAVRKSSSAEFLSLVALHCLESGLSASPGLAASAVPQIKWIKTLV